MSSLSVSRDVVYVKFFNGILRSRWWDNWLRLRYCNFTQSTCFMTHYTREMWFCDRLKVAMNLLVVNFYQHHSDSQKQECPSSDQKSTREPHQWSHVPPNSCTRDSYITHLVNRSDCMSFRISFIPHNSDVRNRRVATAESARSCCQINKNKVN